MIILDSTIAAKKIERMAIEVAERNLHTNELILIGIQGHGVVIAEKISAHLKKYFTGTIHQVVLQIDKKSLSDIKLDTDMALQGKNLILVDDVANSGKVMMYALTALLPHMPHKIETLALLERQHKQFPIFINYTGLSVSTTPNQFIQVDVQEDKMVARLFE